ncbi:MAG: sugar phosphate isomerase/epimerase family protein [Thermoguttaceae bacterium]
MKRRDALLLLSVGTAFAAAKAALGSLATQPARCGVGLVIYTLALRRKLLQERQPPQDLFEPLAYLDCCRSLGAGGIQLPLGALDDDASNRLRRQAEQHRMYIEGIVQLPRDNRDLERFEAEVRTAAQVGALALRTTTFSGRRYEECNSLADYHAAAERGRQLLLRAMPVLERHRVRLAIENHKDRRVDELLALLRSVDSPWVGACVDLGNNFALLEDPLVVVEALAPWAFSVHIKDQAVQNYPEGFLFADVPLGEGFLDLKQMVDILRRARPEVRFSLETLTRDPLKVPVLTEKYWATFPDVPAGDLARTLRTVRTHARPLPQISRLPLEQQVAAETHGIEKSLAFARQSLGF